MARGDRPRFVPRLVPGGQEPRQGAGAEKPRPAGDPPASDAELSDADLVARALDGADLAGRRAVPGADAFTVLVARHEGRVLRLLRHLLRNDDDARDAAQDAFLRAWRSLDSFRPDGSFRNWLLRIAVNAARDDWRRRGAGRLEVVETPPEAEAAGAPGAAAEGAIFEAQLRRLARQLNPREREVFLLRDLEGLEVEEVARVLDLAEPTVRRHLARARLALRELLGR